MIKFFRKIRQRLLGENRFNKYLIYAVGEIILVMIGILLALQVSNWNEIRTKDKKENFVLASIHKEFKANKKQLDSIIKQHKMVRRNCAKIIDFFPITSKPKPHVLDSLSAYLFNSYGGYTFNPSQTSIQSLASTSSFDIIKNDTLRELLISWNDLIEDYKEEELRASRHMTDVYDTYMSKHFDWDFNFKDKRNDFKALQSLQFEYLVKNNHELLRQILMQEGELPKVQEALQMIIRLSKPKNQ